MTHVLPAVCGFRGQLPPETPIQCSEHSKSVLPHGGNRREHGQNPGKEFSMAQPTGFDGPARILAAHVIATSDQTLPENRRRAMLQFIDRGYPAAFVLAAFEATPAERLAVERYAA